MWRQATPRTELIAAIGCAITVAVLAAVPSSAAELRPPPGASSCTGCHAAGAAMGGLDGRPAAEIADALANYRSGAQAGTIMGRIAKGFTPEESQAIAVYFAGRIAR